MAIFTTFLSYFYFTEGRDEFIEFKMNKNTLIQLIDDTLENNKIKFEKKCNGNSIQLRLKRVLLEEYYFPKYELIMKIIKTPYKTNVLILGKETEKNQKVRKFLRSKLRKEIFKIAPKYIDV